MDTLEIHATPSLADFNEVYGRKLRGRVAMLAFPFFMILIVWTMGRYSPDRDWFFTPFTCAVYLFVYALLSIRIVRITYKKSVTWREQHTIRLADTGITYQTSCVTSHFEWQSIKHFKEGRRLFRLTLHNGMAYVIPKPADVLEQGTLRKLLNDHAAAHTRAFEVLPLAEPHAQ